MIFETPKNPEVSPEKLEAEFKQAAETQILTLREMVKSGELKTEAAQTGARTAAHGTEEIVRTESVR